MKDWLMRHLFLNWRDDNAPPAQGEEWPIPPLVAESDPPSHPMTAPDTSRASAYAMLDLAIHPLGEPHRECADCYRLRLCVKREIVRSERLTNFNGQYAETTWTEPLWLCRECAEDFDRDGAEAQEGAA